MSASAWRILHNGTPPFPVPFTSVLVNPRVRLVLLTAKNGMKPTATANQNLLQDLFQNTTDLFARTRTWPHSRVMRLPQQNSWCRPSPFWPALMSNTSLRLPNFQIVPSSSHSHHFLLGTPFPLDCNNGRIRLRRFCGLLHEECVHKRWYSDHKFLRKAFFQLRHGVLDFIQSVGLLQRMFIFASAEEQAKDRWDIQNILRGLDDQGMLADLWFHNPNAGNNAFRFENGKCSQSPVYPLSPKPRIS